MLALKSQEPMHCSAHRKGSRCTETHCGWDSLKCSPLRYAIRRATSWAPSMGVSPRFSALTHLIPSPSHRPKSSVVMKSSSPSREICPEKERAHVDGDERGTILNMIAVTVLDDNPPSTPTRDGVQKEISRILVRRRGETQHHEVVHRIGPGPVKGGAASFFIQNTCA